MFNLAPLKFNLSAIFFPIMLIWSHGFVNGSILSLLFIVSLLFHEYAHVYIAKQLGYKTKSVTIMFFGAFAHILGDWVFVPSHEKKIAAAGPVVSILLGLIAVFINMLVGENYYLYIFVLINLVLGFFNILPLYPTDGGRIFHKIPANGNPWF